MTTPHYEKMTPYFAQHVYRTIELEKAKAIVEKIPNKDAYDYVGRYIGGLVRVKTGVFPRVRCGFIDADGNVQIPLEFWGAKDFSEGYAAVRVGPMHVWGFINTRGELVTPCIFTKPRPFREGLAKVVCNGVWCFINYRGEIVISLKQYTGGSTFHDGYAIVSKRLSSRSYDEVFGIIDKTGKEVVPCVLKLWKIGRFFDCDHFDYNIKLYNEGVYQRLLEEAERSESNEDGGE